MGIKISNILISKNIEINELSGNSIAIDAYNTLYQFLSAIRDRFTGEPLKDSNGKIASHLSGLFYRTSKLIQYGINPIFVFDGEKSELKSKTINERRRIKEKAIENWKKMVKEKKIESIMKYAQSSSFLNLEMVNESKSLLNAMGIPYINALSEGEAQCAKMCENRDVYAVSSQDIDTLLFGSPKLIRNLSITGKRKVPGKSAFFKIKPELIELKELLNTLKISREQLIILGILPKIEF